MSWFSDDDKERKGRWPVWDYLFKYFPLAFLEEVRVAVIGNEQHNPGQPLHWAREKSTDQLNTALRHQFDYAKLKAEGVIVPRDAKGNAVLAQAIWRLKAQLQRDLESEAEVKAASAQEVPEQPKATGNCACGGFTVARGEEYVSPGGVSHTEGMCTPGGTRCPTCKGLSQLEKSNYFGTMYCRKCSRYFTPETPA